MSRLLATGIIALVGFAIGFLGFLGLPLVAKGLVNWIPTIDQSIAFAMISGMAGSAISTPAVTMWAKRI